MAGEISSEKWRGKISSEKWWEKSPQRNGGENLLRETAGKSQRNGRKSHLTKEEKEEMTLVALHAPCTKIQHISSRN